MKPTFSGSIGIQTSLPVKSVTPAIRLEVGPEILIKPSFFVTPLLGFGKDEWLTVGGRLWVFLDNLPLVETFAVFHTWKRWSILAGVHLFSFSPSYIPLFL
ncbi:hypothetical protein GX441_00335 [bacterium]|nr:hypothetical protein [bacterium]